MAVPAENRRRQRRRAHESVPARDAELLRTAAAMCLDRGYANTSISEIAAALGIAKGSVYHDIDSKTAGLVMTTVPTQIAADNLLAQVTAGTCI